MASSLPAPGRHGDRHRPSRIRVGRAPTEAEVMPGRQAALRPSAAVSVQGRDKVLIPAGAPFVDLECRRPTVTASNIEGATIAGMR